MKSRVEKYSETTDAPKRVEKNFSLYDDLYSQKNEPASNVTVLDNVNEIDINKIKEMINNREDYKKLRKYQDLVEDDLKNTRVDSRYDIDEVDSRNYDINKIIEKKKTNLDGVFEEKRVRKISDTQYDILRDLEVSKQVTENDCEDVEHMTQERQLKNLIHTITKEKDDEGETNLDMFSDLKGEDDTVNVTAPIKKEDKNKDDSFYSSSYSFKKDDFEEVDDFIEKEKSGTLFKITIGILIFLIVLVIAFIIMGFMDIKAFI